MYNLAGAAGATGIVIVCYVNPTPTITVSPPSYAFPDTFLNKTNSCTYTVAGVLLSDNITITRPTEGFTISTDNVDFASSSLVLTTNAAGTVASTTIYVHFVPTVEKLYDAYITNSSAGVAAQTVHVTGTGEPFVPLLTVLPTSPLNLGNVITNKTSTNFTYTLSGGLLTDNVTVTAPSDYFKVSSNGTDFVSSFTLTTNASGGLDVTPIYVQFTPSGGAVSYAGSITNSSSGAVNKMVALTGTGVVQTLNLGAETLAFGYVLTNTIPANQSFTVSGANLETNVTVTVPSAFFAVSTNSTGSFGSSCTVLVAGASSPSGATLASTLVYVRFTPLTEMAYGGDITCASAGAVSTNKAVSGNGAVQYIGVQQPAGTALADNGPAVDFGNVELSATKTFVVTNSGNITLTLSGITKNGTHSNEFTVGGTLPGTLAVGASTTFTVTFRPAALGARTAALHIGNGAGDGSFDIALTGTGSQGAYRAFGGDIKLLWTNNMIVYAVHVFTNVGTANFILSKNINAGVLVVGGGGSAGGSIGGGGGGGAVVYVTNATVNAGTYTVTVGAGGGAPASGAFVGSNGVASSVAFGSTISAAGGGGGGAYVDGNGANGGCGGGAGASSIGTPTGGCGYVASGGHAAFTTGSSLGGFASGAIHGNPGGNVTNTRGAVDATYARGGGGAGVAATDGLASTNSAGAGGDGIQIVDYALGGSYSNLYWGGGGGGGAYHPLAGEHGGAGGKGGGGGGGSGNTGPLGGTGGLVNGGDGGTGVGGTGGAGGDNTGGGGGGAGNFATAGAKGGSGIVIIRYAIFPPRGTVIMMR